MIAITSSEAKQKRLTTMRKGVVAAAQAIEQKFITLYGEAALKNLLFLPSSPYRSALITLTYRPDVDWEPHHIASLVKHYREWMRRNHGLAFHYVWTVELQGNGKPHYHMVVWLPRGVKPPLPDTQGWWPHGMSNAKYARSPVGYIAKYASKSEGKSGEHLPKRARLWGYGGLSGDEKAPVLYALAPRWLRFVVPVWSMPRKRSVEITEDLPGVKGGRVTSKVTAWVLTCAGLFNSWAYLGPYDFDRFDHQTRDLVVRHRGQIDLLLPDGDHYIIPHEHTK